MRRTFFWFFFALLVSCRSDQDEASRSVIDGVWESGCVSAAAQSSQRIRYSFFANNTVQRVAEFFADSNCATSRGTLSHIGVFEIAVRTDVSDYEIDLFFREVVGVPTDEAGAAAWNTQNFCGLTRWLARVDENVIAQTDPACGVYGVSRIEYRDLLSLEPGERLVFASQLNHAVPRPDAIEGEDAARVFHYLRP